MNHKGHEGSQREPSSGVLRGPMLYLVIYELDLPSPGLQHVGFIQSSYGETLHGSDQIFTDLK